jgi:polyhydroxyalkanoate synthesis regulator phasin
MNDRDILRTRAQVSGQLAELIAESFREFAADVRASIDKELSEARAEIADLRRQIAEMRDARTLAH